MKNSFVNCLTLKEEKKIISITLNSESKNRAELILSGKNSFLIDYYHFFSKENIYILFQRIFHRGILNNFLINFSNWKLKKIKTFQKIFFGLFNYLYIFPQNYLKINSVSQIKKLSQTITLKKYWKIFNNTLRSQILRNNNLSVRFTFITLQFFKFWFFKPSKNENLEFLFSRINFTKKNRNLNSLIFRLFFYVYLFNFKKKNNFKLKIQILDILLVNIINGEIKGGENFYMKPLKISSSFSFKLDNYYQVFKIFFFLKQIKKYTKDKTLKYNFNSIFLKTKEFYFISQKNFICTNIKNLFNFLTNLNGVEFSKLSAIKVCNSNFKIHKQVNLAQLRKMNNRRLTFNGIEIKIFLGIKIIRTFLKNQLFEKSNFESFNNKFFSKIKKQNDLKKDAKKFPPILVFNKILVKMFDKKSIFSKIIYSHSIFFKNTQQKKKLRTKKFRKNSNLFKIFSWDFKNKLKDKIKKLLNFYFLLFYNVIFATQITKSNLTVLGSFSFWNFTSDFKLPKRSTKLINIKEPKITLDKIKNLKKDLIIKVENHLLFSKKQFNFKNYNTFHHFLKELTMVFFLSINPKFVLKSFHFQIKKINFYLLINSVIKNFYIFMVTKDLRKNFYSILKKNFQDTIHFRHSICKLFLENYYDFKILFYKLIV